MDFEPSPLCVVKLGLGFASGAKPKAAGKAKASDLSMCFEERKACPADDPLQAKAKAKGKAKAKAG